MSKLNWSLIRSKYPNIYPLLKEFSDNNDQLEGSDIVHSFLRQNGYEINLGWHQYWQELETKLENEKKQKGEQLKMF